MNQFILALVLGVFFGFALNKAGLTHYTKIVNVFRLNDMAVLKFMMTALVVTMLGVYPLRMLGVITFPTVPATYIVGNLVGGLIFGVGMALAGFCPGTCAAGAGEGKLDYLIPGLLGFLTGAAIFGLTYDKVFPADLQAAELRRGRHPRPVERQRHPGRRRLRRDGPGALLHDRPHGLAAQAQG